MDAFLGEGILLYFHNFSKQKNVCKTFNSFLTRKQRLSDLLKVGDQQVADEGGLKSSFLSLFSHRGAQQVLHIKSRYY